MKITTIRGKVNGMFEGVSSLFNPRDTQEIGYNINVCKDGNEDVNQVIPDNLYDMLVTEFPTQKKDEHVTPDNFEEIHFYL